ncbi:hypothetical protein HMPREF9332_01356 [Alloprevotella rava F0323]|uniref:Polysaccharide chain length determinant N-terminal domain-containing protein n=1 Tax=Alloprevotella rava F0323 TaxID=679199 RepID=G5GCQ5_9BACT|nr:hypothetical protein [Alloprevotella rava]EHG22551.1 hypothetical protein HMPREF9332_01356 [Alloprevotella rava F0323]
MSEENKFNFEYICKKIITDRISLVVFLLLGLLVGIFVAIQTPQYYTAQTLLAPEQTGKSSLSESVENMLKDLEVDFNTNTSADGVYPALYPDIFSTKSFIVELFSVPVTLETGITKTYYRHLVEDTKLGLAAQAKRSIMKLFPKKKAATSGEEKLDPFRLTDEQEDIVELIQGSMACIYNRRAGIICITAVDQDPHVAASLVDTLQNRLKRFVADYKTQKERIALSNAQKALDESRAEYEKAKKRYTAFADANQDVTLQTIGTQLATLENELQIAYQHYEKRQKQLQKSRADVQYADPVFVQLSSPTIPNHQSGISPLTIVLIWVLLFVVLDGLWVVAIKERVSFTKSQS